MEVENFGSLMDAICFLAQIIKLQTMVDGAIRVTIDLPETAVQTMALLAECKSRGGLIEVAAVPVENIVDGSAKQSESRENAEIPARSEWQS